LGAGGIVGAAAAAAAASASAQTQTALGASLGSLAAVVMIGAVVIYFYYSLGRSRKTEGGSKAQSPTNTIDSLRRQAWLENQRPFIQTNPLLKAQSAKPPLVKEEGEESSLDLSLRDPPEMASSSLTGDGMGGGASGSFHDSPFLRARSTRAFIASNSKAHLLKPQTSTFHINNPLYSVQTGGEKFYDTEAHLK
jgi:hypothetical protein